MYANESNNSSKNLALGDSVSDLPFNRHLDDSDRADRAGKRRFTQIPPLVMSDKMAAKELTAARDVSIADVSNTAVKPFKGFLELPTPDGPGELSYSKDSLKLDDVVIELGSNRKANLSLLEQQTPNFEEDLSSLYHKTLHKKVVSSIAFRPEEEPESELMLARASPQLFKAPSI